MEAIREPVPSPVKSMSTSKFKVGDRVKVQLEVEVFRAMQDGHGGWNDKMTEVRSYCVLLYHII